MPASRLALTSYLIIFAVNMLSNVALLWYATGAINSRQELMLEAVYSGREGSAS